MKELKLIGGGGNSLKPSHNHGLHLFLRCLDDKTHGGVVCYGNKNCHTEDNSPKYRMVGKMKGNNFTDKVFSRFTSHFSLKRACATHVALCDRVGSYYRHWCGAFTLAEVLVTLGIIGVVSAMTVPTLMQNYQRQSYVTQLHKVYNELNQATLRYQTDRNALNLKEAGLTSQAAAENFIENNFKIVQKCGSNKTPCFASSYKKIAGTSSIGWYTPRTNYIIASGTAIGVSYRPVGDVLLELYVDTNGAKGPNITGRDIFAMFIYNNGIIDDFNFSENTTAPMTEAARNTNYTNVCAADTTSWHGCLGKVINDNWQMTY